MMDLIFQFLGDYVLVRIEGNQVYLSNSSQGNIRAPINGLKLSYEGVIKEFPDLKDTSSWKEVAIVRFKEKLSSMESEDERAIYLIEDLRQHGYKPMFKQKVGFRREIIK